MGIGLQVETTVKKLDGEGTPIDPEVYKSTTTIMADTDCSISITIPRGNSCVDVQAGSKVWLCFFGIDPAKGDDDEYQDISFVASDDEDHETRAFELQSGPVAYWGEDAIGLLYQGTDGESLKELKQLTFTNKGCEVKATIYFVRKVSKKQPTDPCAPKKPTQKAAS